MASSHTAEGSDGGDGFDAAKQGSLPLDFLGNVPSDLPAVTVGLVSPTVGYGLFAARDIGKNEFIFTEAPLMTGLYNEMYVADPSLVHSQHQAYREALAHSRFELNTAFPLLAARNGFHPLSYNEAQRVLVTTIGKNLIHGRLGATTVSQVEYESYSSRFHVAEFPLEEDSRRAALDFFKHYAFQARRRGLLGRSLAGGIGRSSPLDPPASAVAAADAVGLTTANPSTNEACIYLLGSLINHCCTPAGGGAPDAWLGPNCEWRIGSSGLAQFVPPRHICVQARRAIKQGEQLTWDYGKREKSFVCECANCRRNLVAHYCRVL
ncbi:hypothetical protein B0T22DRAFT_56257 [Podospora appendiculata]|uniref:SET domain-containing protein n=1 Tax=Podospora appendiculata TaxID=314037 RepID=A0AAE0XJ76_9PEZI|nr:hypothetical protein B0T22DRAFT_56257 [Podospora appendiculata]